MELYEDFAKSRAKRSVDDVVTSISDEQKEKKATSQGTTHIFQVYFTLQNIPFIFAWYLIKSSRRTMHINPCIDTYMSKHSHNHKPSV